MNTILEQMELRFWDILIPLLTRSRAVRVLLQKTYRLYQNDALIRQLAMLVVISCAGFATGMLAFSLSVLLS